MAHPAKTAMTAGEELSPVKEPAAVRGTAVCSGLTTVHFGQKGAAPSVPVTQGGLSLKCLPGSSFARV